MALSGDRLQRILNTYDTALKGAEDAVLERIYAALDGAAKELESRLTKSYAKYQNTPGLLPNQRMLLIRQEIAEYMALLKPEERGAIEANFERMLAEAADSGINLSQELINATTNTSVAPFATVNLEAVRFQAQDAAKRLYRWSDEYQQKISGIVEMHLAVGSGPQKVASTLRNELGVTKGRAEAIARTESLSSFDSATRENYKRNDVAYVQRIATQDSRTCPYCAARAGKVYRVDEAPAALHPNDRCYSTPWKPEWAALGLVDNAWMEKHAADVQAQVEARGEKLNNGPSPFEKANGLQPPKAVWSPGDPLPVLPEKPKAAATPKAPKGLVIDTSPEAVKQGIAQWNEFIKNRGLDLSSVPRPAYEGRGLNKKLVPFTTDQKIASSMQIAKDINDGAQLEESKGIEQSQSIAVFKDSQGRIQGMAVYTGSSDSIYINRIATAPWNQDPETREASGVGKEMIREGVRRSISKGFDGRLTTDPVGDSKSFYEYLGFEQKNKQRSELELSPEKAKQLLSEQPKPTPTPVAPRYPAKLPRDHAIALTPTWKSGFLDSALNAISTEGAAERVGKFREYVKKSGAQAIFYDTAKPYSEQEATIRDKLKYVPNWYVEDDWKKHTSLEGKDPSFMGFTFPADNHVVIGANRNPGESRTGISYGLINQAVKTVLEFDENGDTLWATSDVDPLDGETANFITYLHEMGHRVHLAAGTPQSPKSILDTYTRYGGENDLEFFAEHFTMWMLDAEALRSANAEIADFIEQTMDEALKRAKPKSQPKQAAPKPQITPALQELYAKLDTLDPSSSEWYQTLLQVEAEEEKAKAATVALTTEKKPTPQTLEKAGQKRFEATRKKIDSFLTEDAAERQRRVDELVQKFQAKTPETEGLNFASEYAKAIATTGRATAEMEKFRKSLISKGLNSDEARALVDEIEVDLPEKFAPFVDQLKDDLTEFFQITKGKGSKSLATIIKDSDRAYAHEDGTLNVGTDINNKTVMFHEAGHHIEFEDDDIRVAMQGWMKSRAESLTPVSLNKIVKGGNFDRTEKAYKGDYIDPYVGKVYDDGYTEVLSMGIQHFASAKSMLELYRKDPGMFNLILGVILK